VDPWLRQDIDTEASYKAFLVYRDMGPGRRLVIPGTPPQVLLDWFNTHGWADRVKAYDRWLDGQRLSARADRAKAYAASQESDHRALLGDARALVALELEKRVKASLEAGEAPTLSVAELAKLTDLTLKYERVQAGLPTDRVKLDLSNLDDTEIAEALRLAEKAERGHGSGNPESGEGNSNA